MTRLIALIIALGCATTTLVLAQAQRSVEAQFKAAQHADEIEGDLKKAIEQYRRISESGDRATAARALIRMAECHQKLGNAEAKNIYERIVREYGDQPHASREARNRLAEFGTPANAADSHVVARQIWVGNEVNIEGMPSPDGKVLTFIDYGTTNSGNVAVRNLTTGRNTRLTHASAADGYAYDPVMSPDGKQVAYMFYGERRTSVRTVGVDGGQPRVIARFDRHAVYQPRWSPDGRRLAVIARESGIGTWQILLVDVAEGSVKTLKSTEWRGPVLGGFSPDGRFLLYAIPKVGSNTDTGIYVIAVDGTRETALVRGTSDDRSPVWTPDGLGVVFLSDKSGSNDLWFVAARDGKLEGEPAIVRFGVGNIINMGFTRDGSYFYGTRNAKQDVYITEMGPTTLDVNTKPKRMSDQFVGSNAAPAWSPDGRFVAFVRGPDRLKRSIVVRSTVEGSERTLAMKLDDGFAAGAFGVRWLPDSRTLLVPEADYTKRTMTIHQVNVETGQVQTLLQDGLGKVYPRFAISPDGRIVYFTRRDTEVEVLRLIKRDTLSGRETELYQADLLGVGLFGLAISPDGEHLSFSVNASDKGDRHLVVVPSAGGPARILYRGNATHPTPRVGVWTRDGQYVLAAVEEASSMWRMWAFPVDGAEPKKLNIAFESIGHADLSYHGRRFAFTGIQTMNEVWTIKNLLKRSSP